MEGRRDRPFRRSGIYAMRRILCFGDSNTWGYEPGTGARFGPDIRWTGRLQKTLGSTVVVMEEGLNGRTAVLPDLISSRPSAMPYLADCLASHAPLDMVVIMLGTNDMKARFGLGAYDIARGVGALVDVVRGSGAGPDGSAPRVLVLCPAPIEELVDRRRDLFAGAVEKSELLDDHLARASDDHGADVLRIRDHVRPSPVDGIHLDERAHAELARLVAERISRYDRPPRPYG